MKYACFDIGNVLAYVDFQPLLTAVSKSFNISTKDAISFLSNNQKKCDLGLTTVESELLHFFDIRSDILLNELISHWNNSIQYDGRMNALLEELQAEGVEIALLSNIGHEHMEIASKWFDCHKIKCVRFFSCQVGARKPTMLYYHTFLSMYPQYKGCVYIDDVQENLDAGKAFGFDTVHFALDAKPTERDIASIKERILL